MPHKFHASRRHEIPKTGYAVKNWPTYEAALRQRGDSRVWIGSDVEAHWTVSGKRTAKGYPVDTDLAIETVLTLRWVFHQPLRQTEGLVGSIFDMLSLDLVVDSTGLKVYGQGEWQRKRFGERKTGKPCSAWRKLHLGIDPGDGEIVASDLTDHDVGDVAVLPDLVDQVGGRLDNFLADDAYDGDPAYRLLTQRRQVLPLPKVIGPRLKSRHPDVQNTDPLRIVKRWSAA